MSLIGAIIGCLGADGGQVANTISYTEVHTGIAFAGKNVRAFGDSITAGYITTDTANRWLNKLCVALGANPVNGGVAGQTMQRAGSNYFDPSVISAYDAANDACLLFALGVNDCGINNGVFNSYAYYTDFLLTIDAAKAKGWPVNRIIVLSLYKPFSWNTYVGSFALAAAADDTRAQEYVYYAKRAVVERGCFFFDMYTAMNGLDATYFAPDGLHPNDAGHNFIGTNLAGRI